MSPAVTYHPLLLVLRDYLMERGAGRKGRGQREPHRSSAG